MGRYAARTSVSSSKSREEIERTLVRYGATGFAYGWHGERAYIGFEMAGRQMKFIVPMPDKNAEEFWRTPSTRQRRTAAKANEEWEKATRQRWRALALVIKAKLEAVESEITTLEQEFLAHIVLPDGSTVGGWIAPQIEAAYTTGRMPALLPALPAHEEDDGD